MYFEKNNVLIKNYKYLAVTEMKKFDTKLFRDLIKQWPFNLKDRRLINLGTT